MKTLAKTLLGALLLILSINVLADDRSDLFRPKQYPNLPELGSTQAYTDGWLVTVPSDCVKRKDTSEQCKQKFQHRLEIKEARKLMPELPGLRPERLSVRRGGVIFSYSW